MCPRRTIEELATRYRLGQVDGREVYVEGLQDKAILDHFTRSRGVRADVYTVGSVIVPAAAITDRGLDNPSSRSGVIALRAELERNGVNVEEHIFLVDRDQEDLVPTPYIDGCDMTAFGTLAVHLVGRPSIERLCSLAARQVIDADTLEESIYRISKSLYAVRSAAKRKAIPLKMLAVGAFISGRSTSGFDIDMVGYLSACLFSSGLVDRRDEVLEEVQLCVRDIEARSLDPRVFINDHELWVIIKTILSKSGDKVNRSAEDVRDMFLVGCEIDALDDVPFFSRLMEK